MRWPSLALLQSRLVWEEARVKPAASCSGNDCQDQLLKEETLTAGQPPKAAGWGLRIQAVGLSGSPQGCMRPDGGSASGGARWREGQSRGTGQDDLLLPFGVGSRQPACCGQSRWAAQRR